VSTLRCEPLAGFVEDGHGMAYISKAYSGRCVEIDYIQVRTEAGATPR
jgi:hypothetical protein